MSAMNTFEGAAAFAEETGLRLTRSRMWDSRYLLERPGHWAMGFATVSDAVEEIEYLDGFGAGGGAGGAFFVFVYGSILSGLANNGRMDESILVGTARTEPGAFELLDLGAFPGMVNSKAPLGAGTVTGEVYLCPRATLASLDRLEGHPSFYCRKPVRLAWTKLGRDWNRRARGLVAETYIYQHGHRFAKSGALVRVESGDWKAHLRARDDRNLSPEATYRLRTGRWPAAKPENGRPKRRTDPIFDW